MKSVDEIFLEAVGLNPAERAAFLDRACQDQPSGIRSEVERLLDADAKIQADESQFLKPLSHGDVDAQIVRAGSSRRMPERIGPYLIKKCIGEGGFGEVYQATRVAPYQQDVALKVIGAWHCHQDDYLARFNMERQVLAGLVHENIARLLDGGETDDGRPYFVMELVEGSPITDYCCAHRLSVRQRLRLVEQVCRAVAHAHRHGVIHRDIKPSNILVTRKGTPKLLDFGIAKLTDAASTRRMLATTRTGMLPMTPEYASPEQVRGTAITTASDVYSLGVVMYELLAECRPYSLVGQSPTQVERTICEMDPAAPSVAVGRKRAGRNGNGKAPSPCPLPRSGGEGIGTERDAASLQRMLRGDLDNIVLKALQKEPSRRYLLADEMAGDIERYFEELPLLARPPSTSYRARKFIRRYKWFVAATVTIVVLLFAGVTASTIGFMHALRQKSLAQRELARSERLLYNLQLGRVAQISQRAPARALALLSDPEVFPLHLREFTWALSRRFCQPNRMVLRGHTDAVRSVAFSPSEDVLASGGKDNVVRFWASDTGEELATLLGHADWINALAFSPDGTLLASASRDRTVRIWDVRDAVESGEPRPSVAGMARSGDRPQGGGQISRTDFQSVQRNGRIGNSPSSLVLQGMEGGRIENPSYVSRKHNELKATLTGHARSVECLAFSPDGSMLASGSSDQSVYIWDVETGEILKRIQRPESSGAIRCLAFSPDGSTLAFAGLESRICLCDLKSDNVESVSLYHKVFRYDFSRFDVTSLAYSGDGRRLAASYVISSGETSFIILWDLATKTYSSIQEGMKRGHQLGVYTIAFSPDGKMLASAGTDRTVRLWDVERGRETVRLDGHAGLVRSLAFSRDGKTLASAGYDHTVRLWNVTGEYQPDALVGHKGAVHSIACSQDGATLASGGEDGTVKLWNLMSKNMISTLAGHTDVVRCVAISPVSDLVASGSFDKTIRLWNGKSGEPVACLTGHEDRVQAVAFSPDGSTLASASRDRTVRLWSATTHKVLATLAGHTDLVATLAFSPNGRWLASGSRDRAIRLWDVQTGRTIQELDSLTPLGAIAFSPDGKTLATGPRRLSPEGPCDGTIALWNLDSGTVEGTCHGHSDEVFSLAFTSDGQTLASASADRTIRLWDVNTGQERTALTAHDTWVYAVAFTPDETILASAGDDIRLWRVGNGQSPEAREGTTANLVKSADTIVPSDAADPTAPDPVRLRTTLGSHAGLMCLAFSPDSRILAAGDSDETIYLWDIENGAQPVQLQGHQGTVGSLGFSPDGKRLASSSSDNTVKLWRVADHTIERTVTELKSGAVKFSPDGNTLTSLRSDGSLMAWDLPSGKLSAALKMKGAHLGPLIEGMFSPLGDVYICVASDGTVRAWDTATWKEETLWDLRGDLPVCLDISADGHYLALGGPDIDEPISIWDLSARRKVSSLSGHERPVNFIAFSPDGKILATAAMYHDGNVRFWDVKSGQEIHRVAVPGSQIGAFAWSPDGKKLVTFGVYGHLSLWDVDLERLRAKRARER